MREAIESAAPDRGAERVGSKPKYLQLLIDAKSSVDRPNTAGDTALIQVRMWEASAVRVRAAACACKQFCAHPSSDLWTNAFPSCTLM